MDFVLEEKPKMSEKYLIVCDHLSRVFSLMFLLLDGTNIYNMSGTNAEGTSLYLPCVHVWCIVPDRRFVTEQMNEK